MSYLKTLAIFLFSCNLHSFEMPNEYKKLTKLNENPIDMHSSTSALCMDPRSFQGPHLAAKMVYYVNEKAISVKEAGVKFPVGSIIVKEKIGDNNGASSGDVLTIMRKINTEENIKSWEFKIYSLSDMSDLTDRFNKNMPTSCVDCHEKYKNDYVSPSFLTISSEYFRNKEPPNESLHRTEN